MSNGAYRPIVPSIVAESYVRQIMTTIAQHQRSEFAVESLTRVQGRLAVLPSGHASAQIRAQATLVRLVSIAESFASSQLVTRLEAHVPMPRSALVEDMYRREENTATSSWDQMTGRYKRWANGIALSSLPGHETVMTLVEARNAITHGLGRLTRRQLRDPAVTSTISRMATIGITTDRDQVLIIGQQTLTQGAKACRSFIESLDGALLTTL